MRWLFFVLLTSLTHARAREIQPSIDLSPNHEHDCDDGKCQAEQSMCLLQSQFAVQEVLRTTESSTLPSCDTQATETCLCGQGSTQQQCEAGQICAYSSITSLFSCYTPQTTQAECGECVVPTTKGYDISSASGTKTIKGFNPTGVKCATGYMSLTGVVTYTVCASAGKAYSVGGCQTCASATTADQCNSCDGGYSWVSDQCQASTLPKCPTDTTEATVPCLCGDASEWQCEVGQTCTPPHDGATNLICMELR